MKTKKFTCRLLSDVVLNNKSATEGQQQTLDFIPGGCFLGIAAKEYDSFGKDSFTVFHSGKVRFGDAHIMLGASQRTFKIPAALYQPKFCKDVFYVEFKTPEVVFSELQLKQCREGFYGFYMYDSGYGTSYNLVKTDLGKTFFQKSAYDYSNRRSKDKQMFGYESLAADSVFCFSIDYDDDIDEKLIEKISSALEGRRFIGRSRTAQYGLVDIQCGNFDELKSHPLKDEYATVYAESRLIFFDSNGNLTYCPTAQDLGFASDATIEWDKSQVRTFSYSPWNYKRQTYDTARAGIEKGSVFVVKTGSSPSESAYVGRYNNEGFGKVLYNPAFFNADADGKSIFENYRIVPPKDSNVIDKSKITTPLLKYLLSKQQTADNNENAYNDVERFIDDNRKLFLAQGEKFASQWGSIRSLAMIQPDGVQLMNMVDKFLDHGVAKDKWEERGRKANLYQFMEKHKTKNLQDKLINLCSEMAKLCKKQTKAKDNE